MSQNNLEDQTNKKVLTTEEFRSLYEPKLTQLIEQGVYGSAMVAFFDVARNFRVEPELRIELLFGLTVSQFLYVQKFQREQFQAGTHMASVLGITDVEKATVKALLAEYIKGMGVQDGQAQ